MPYAMNEGLIGFPEVGDIFVPDTTQRVPLGQMITGIDPFFGYGEFVYGQATAAHAVGRWVTLNQVFATTDAPNSAGVNSPVFVAAANMPIGAYGWYAMAGMRPCQVGATVAAGAILGITAAGVAGAGATTKYLAGTRVIQSQTYAPTLAKCTTRNGAKFVFVPSVDGLFVGLTVSGTGVSGTIAAIDPSQNMITLSAAATATGSVTITFTWTGFSLVQLNRPFAAAFA